ncbi:MAG: hypothetical protein A4E49_02769 [Methanosaeta sp. PtaU1.Bin112]|nr:MAG: hypothetical protein A4E49_02769 [Methanosaeta sp. PtaU1.Bin112]
MQTGGYDVVVELNEQLVSSFLKLGHCMGKFPKFAGTYTLPIPDVPSSLAEFMDIGYEVSLNKAPEFQIRNDLTLEMGVRGQCEFNVLGGIEFEMEVEFSVLLVPSFNQSTRRFKVDFVEASIDDVELNDTYHLPHNVISKLNEILSIAMAEYLTEDVTSIELSPVLFSTELPYMPPGDENKLAIGLGNVKILSPQVIAGAVNLLGYTGGNVLDIMDFTDGNHIGIGVGESGMHRVYDFWWQRTVHPKLVTVTGSKDFDMPSFVDWIDDFVDWIVAIGTLGLVDVEIDLLRVWAEYGATIHFNQLAFDLKPSNIVELSGSVTIDLWCKVYAQIKTTTEIFWGLVEVDEDISTIKPFDCSISGVTINLENAHGQVALNSDRQLTIDLLDADFDIPLQWEIPEFILDWVVDWAVDQVIDNLPPVVLFPAIIEQNIPESTVTVEASINKLVIDEPEVLVAANIATSGLGTYAPYIGNKNPESMEVHTRDCNWAHRIAMRNRVYFCEIDTAIAAGFNGCAYCLQKYNTG